MAPRRVRRVRDRSRPRCRPHRAAAAAADALLLIIVNDVGDLGRATTGCDSDAIAPGDQCTLRAALDVAASVTDDVVIHFSFDASQLDPTGKATINLTHALQTLTKSIPSKVRALTC
jgi:hypothetical protein